MNNNPPDIPQAALIAFTAISYLLGGTYILLFIIPAIIIFFPLYLILDLISASPVAVMALLALRPITPIQVIVGIFLVVLTRFSNRRPRDRAPPEEPDDAQRRRLVELGILRPRRNVDPRPRRQEEEAAGGEQEGETSGREEPWGYWPDAEHEDGEDDGGADQ